MLCLWTFNATAWAVIMLGPAGNYAPMRAMGLLNFALCLVNIGLHLFFKELTDATD